MYQIQKNEKNTSPLSTPGRVFNSLNLSHLNEEEKEYVAQWSNEFPDIFHINGQKITANDSAQHRIPLTEDIVIQQEQYSRTQNSAQDKKNTMLLSIRGRLTKNSSGMHTACQTLL